MHNDPLVSIQIVVRNGARYIRHCLDAVARQTYPNIEVIVLDNNSDDGTPDIVSREYPQYRLFRHDTNLGMWPGQEHLLTLSTGEFVIGLSVDVIMDRDFVAQAVYGMLEDERIGAVQGRVYQYSLRELSESGTSALRRDIIDTCGFGLTRARRVVNIHHGQPEHGPATATDIFGVEGAVPVFRRSALEACRVDGRIWDVDYFWYGDDFDVAWRLNLFGYRQRFVPSAIAWHDRSTTKGTAAVPVIGQLQRRAYRQSIPLQKRRLDWSNVRFTIIKNDYIINILRDFPWILLRELATLGYTVAFEPGVLREIGRFVRLLPRMVRRRRIIMRHAVVSASQLHRQLL